MHDWSVKMTRRSALALSGTLPAAVLPSNSGVSQADAACNEVDAMADAVSKKLFSGDGLARPVPDVRPCRTSRAGLDHTLVLGGGGEYYVAQLRLLPRPDGTRDRSGRSGADGRRYVGRRVCRIVADVGALPAPALVV